MAVKIELDPKDEEILRAMAARRSQTAEHFVAEMVHRAVEFRRRWDELTKPVHEEFERSGMTDDELSAFLEEEKHAMRAEKRARGG